MVRVRKPQRLECPTVFGESQAQIFRDRTIRQQRQQPAVGGATLQKVVIRMQSETVVAYRELDVMPIVRRGRLNGRCDELKYLGSIRSEHRLRFQRLRVIAVEVRVCNDSAPTRA